MARRLKMRSRCRRFLHPGDSYVWIRALRGRFLTGALAVHVGLRLMHRGDGATHLVSSGVQIALRDSFNLGNDRARPGVLFCVAVVGRYSNTDPMDEPRHCYRRSVGGQISNARRGVKKGTPAGFGYVQFSNASNNGCLRQGLRHGAGMRTCAVVIFTA